MSTLEAIILGLIQGLTEFFPVSSSGHLALGQHLLGMKSLRHYIFFNLICHLGTLISLFIVYFTEIKKIIWGNTREFKQILVGTLPLIPLVLLLKPIKSVFDHPYYLGYFFFFTSFILSMGIYAGKKEVPLQSQKYPLRDALIIGIFQAIAIFPGVSRSGTTISAGRLLKWQTKDAITFSFMLAIPAILGAITLEGAQLLLSPSDISPDIGFSQYIAGFTVSLVVGYLALRLLIKVAAKEKFGYFAVYCFMLGIFSLFYFD